MSTAAISAAVHSESPILNLAFYKFVELRNLPALQSEVRVRANAHGVKGSILLSPEGINGFLAGAPDALREFMRELRAKPEFADVAPKESFSSHIPFKRMLVKLKKEIITMGRPDLTPSRFTGKRVYPAELKKWIDERKDLVLLDTRNTYEIEQGTFENAVDYGIETFREFPEALTKNRAALKDKTVVMFCTGGIRCEKATALAMEYGIEDVYQLEGGILKYFEDTGGAHFKGDCFVFDGREAVDPNLSGAVDRKFKTRVAKLRLHSNRDCPYAMRVRLVLAEKRLPFQLVEENLTAPSAALLAANPRGSVPVLIHHETELRESSVITQYLAEEFSHEPVLIPDTSERRARMRLWMTWTDDTLAPTIASWQGSDVQSRLNIVEEIHGHLYYLQTTLQRRPFLVSRNVTLADFHVFPFVHALFSAGTVLPGQDRFVGLRQWYDSMLSRRAVQSVLALSRG